MPTFAYSGRTRAGQTVTGERVADTMDAAVSALRREQIMVTRIDAAKAAKIAKAAKPAGPKGGKSVPAKNPRSYAAVLRHDRLGLQLVQSASKILGKQEPHKNFAAVILKVRARTSNRAALADTMKKHPKTFDGLFEHDCRR
jgi:type II secretory pathway component PulF